MKRRKFVKDTSVIAGITILSPQIAFGSKANSAIRIGVIGCGNRGSAVIKDMVQNTNSRIIAMADLFEDKLQERKEEYNSLNISTGGSAVDLSKIYSGSKSYLKLVEDNDVDSVLISSPAYTHPDFLEAAANAGKHIYCEKPAATDISGCKKIEKTGREADGKISIAIGFQIRHATPYVDLVKRIQSGSIGEIVNAQLYYFGNEKPFVSPVGSSFDELKIRNHYHYRSLSGGILLDQGIHMLDVCNWVLGNKPLDAVGDGGRKGGLDFGDTFTNYQLIYNYPASIKVSFHSGKFSPHFGDVCARFIGTKGTAEAHYSRGVYIEGENEWDSGMARTSKKPTAEQRAAGIFTSSLYDSTSNKVKAFIRSIETGEYLNETKSGILSTITAILGAQAAMAKEKITIDELLHSSERLETNLNLRQFEK